MAVSLIVLFNKWIAVPISIFNSICRTFSVFVFIFQSFVIYFHIPGPKIHQILHSMSMLFFNSSGNKQYCGYFGFSNRRIHSGLNQSLPETIKAFHFCLSCVFYLPRHGAASDKITKFIYILFSCKTKYIQLQTNKINTNTTISTIFNIIISIMQ